MPTFDFLLVRGPMLGLLDPHLQHCLLNNNSRPLLGLLGLKKEGWRVTKGSDLLRTPPRRALKQLSLVVSWRPPKLQLELRRVANIGK